MWRLQGVGTLIIILTLVFGVEVLLAAFFGFPNVRAMLDSLALQEKRVLVALMGPLVHQGWGHLVENLVFLIVFGSYVEWQLGSWDFYVSAAGTGYLASWLLLSLGGAGAVGASSVTHGLEALAGFLGLIRLGENLPGVESIPEFLGATLHILPFVFGFGFIYREIEVWLISPNDPTLWIHVLGAFVGTLIGIASFSEGRGNGGKPGEAYRMCCIQQPSKINHFDPVRRLQSVGSCYWCVY